MSRNDGIRDRLLQTKAIAKCRERADGRLPPVVYQRGGIPMGNLSRSVVAASLVLVVATQSLLYAVDGKKAQYIGGTVSGLPEKSEGKLDTTHEASLTFTPDKKALAPLLIPYDKITAIEYGQKAGRRVAAAVFVSPLMLFSKKRKHFLTLTYQDHAGIEQAAVLELGKDIIRTTLTVVQTRSGKDIEYQDEEAKKAGRGGD